MNLTCVINKMCLRRRFDMNFRLLVRDEVRKPSGILLFNWDATNRPTMILMGAVFM